MYDHQDFFSRAAFSAATTLLLCFSLACGDDSSVGDGGLVGDGDVRDGGPGACAPGTFDHDGDPGTACVVWTTCVAGEFISAPGSATTDQTCMACPEGSTTSGENQSMCVREDDCPAGTVQTTAGMGLTPPVCEACVAGEYCAGADTAKVLCAAGDDTWDHDADAATECIDRSRCVAGDSVGVDGDATTDRTCVDCEDGTFSNSLNAASCAPWTVCLPGEQETNPPSSSVDRTCVPIVCGEDERVLANACVPCDFGSTNVPGDDASGADTQCDDACTVVLGLTCAEFEEGYVKASDTWPTDAFGYSVALSGDTLVVGAPGEENQFGVFDSGAVYVFTRTGVTWSQQAYLQASNSDTFDRFGTSLVLSGDTLAVGAPAEDSVATNSGAVYVFTRAGTTWTEEAILKASNAGENDGFGVSVALSGETLVVGASSEASSATGVNGDQLNDAIGFAGAVYVFVRSGTTWSQEAYIKASNTEANDLFGTRLALSGDTLAVAASREDSGTADENDNSISDAGAVYVFTRVGTTWTQQAYLKALSPDVADFFGSSLALEGDTLAVGAIGEDSAATGVGGDETDDSATDSGAVYVFTRSGTTWSQQAYVKASNTGVGDAFGVSLALFGETLAVGAYREDSAGTGIGGDEGDNTAEDAGAVYLFTRAGAVWTQQVYVKASNTEEEDQFGFSIALSGDTLAVGAPQEDSGATGVGGDESSNSAVFSGAVYVRRFAP